MLSSIYIGMSGLQGYSQGLRVIANNTANINTPGYKGSSLQFADMFYSNSNSGSGSGMMQVGYGLNTAGTILNFEQGELRQTGNSLDLAIDGQGLFTVQDSAGNLHYTRAGQFTFNADGVLVSRVDGSKVMGQDANGVTGEITIAGHSTTLGKATTTAKFAGNISSTALTKTIPNVKVIDSVGGEHLLDIVLTNNGATTAGNWTVQLMDGATSVGTAVGAGTIQFSNGFPVAGSDKVTFNYTPAGLAPMTVVFDFSTDVSSVPSGTLSTIAFTTQDGFGPGNLTGVSFDSLGTLVMAYSNGQTVKGSRLSLGRFDSLDAIAATGNNQFDATNSLAWHTGLAGGGGFGSIRSGMVELSNVDLSQEFSDLVIMQRGYQASSQVISTANDMLQELFQMKSK
jgi:flagellar hook protein FlgE